MNFWRRGGAVLAAIIGAAALVIGGLLVAGAVSHHSDMAAPSPSMLGFEAGGLQDPSTADTHPTRSDDRPTSVRIPRIGVDSALEGLALGSSGQLTAPADYDRAGWYDGGVVPGDVGPAIIAGHVDSPAAPAVFARIADLRDGDAVIVTMSSGRTLTFVIDGRTQSAKSRFPTDSVYDNVPRPELRLITCAGTFDPSVGHYTDNLILFASLSD